MRYLACALALVIVSCGDSATDTTTTATSTTLASTTTPQPTTTLAPTTTLPPTTTAPTTTTTTLAPIYYSVANHGIFPVALFTEADGHGSGCTPPGNVLPDGIWFGAAEGLSGSTLTFDLACFWTGAAAQAEAAADGEEAFDFYIRNINPKVFTIPLDPAGSAYSLDQSMPDVSNPLPIPMPVWPENLGWATCPSEGCMVWIFINGGVVTELVEQYLP